MKKRYKIYYSAILAAVWLIHTAAVQDVKAQTGLALSDIQTPDYAVQHWKQEYADIEDYAFYFDGDGGTNGLKPKHGGYRTIPGRFGARESRMGKALLNDTHQKAMQASDISQDDFHRIVLWLDANSMELGSYHDDEAQRAGKVIWPVLEADSANTTGVETERPTRTQMENGV